MKYYVTIKMNEVWIYFKTNMDEPCQTSWSVKETGHNTTSCDPVLMKCPEHKERMLREGVMEKDQISFDKNETVLKINRGDGQWLYTLGKYKVPPNHVL